MVAVLATGIVLVVQNLADAGGCSERTGARLSVAADPAIAPAVRQVADDWIETEQPEIDGDCIAVDVTAAATADVAAGLATSAGGFVDVAGPAGGDAPAAGGDPPAVWVPDSTYWVDRLRSVSRNLFEPRPVPLATSPILLASSPAAAEVLGDGPVAPADLREPVLASLAAERPPPLQIAEPRRDTAGLVGAGWLQQALVTADGELPNLVGSFRGLGDAPPDSATLLTEFDSRQRSAGGGDGEALLMAPVSEQAVTAHNRAAGATTITTTPVADPPGLDFPYAVLGRQPAAVQTAAGMFRDVLTNSGAVFEQHGFRPVDGPPATVGPPEQVAQTLRIWTSATRDARVLSVVNVNASMAAPIGPVRRIDVFQAAAQQGLALFTDGSELGHWEYGDDWVEGAPIETLTEAHQQEILNAIGSVQLRASNESALFEVLLAGYREIKEGYDPGRSNTLIVWTDSGNNQPDGPDLDQTLQELERLADVTRPIRVILIGLGPEADMTQLSALADATGGGAFHIEDPDEIELVFLRALLT